MQSSQTALEPSPVPLTAAGEPIDAARHRRILAAQRAVADAYATAAPAQLKKAA